MKVYYNSYYSHLIHLLAVFFSNQISPIFFFFNNSFWDLIEQENFPMRWRKHKTRYQIFRYQSVNAFFFSFSFNKFKWIFSFRTKKDNTQFFSQLSTLFLFFFRFVFAHCFHSNNNNNNFLNYSVLKL